MSENLETSTQNDGRLSNPCPTPLTPERAIQVERDYVKSIPPVRTQLAKLTLEENGLS